ncbi:hypothetical protein [Xenophilus sp. Marseille-Q4582]|uniref:hypothetical protein n=1 Tax=Xenophilus sp. Marseille-Q4582 TaxID=2866600 RepID=UPI001CE44146|nr:hypothetical protein [Xenophilus sp. Marseille-Q4582]
MTKPSQDASLAASDDASSLGHEYVLSQPLELPEFGGWGGGRSDAAAVPLEQLDARDVQAFRQWQDALRAVRQALTGRRS